MKRKILFSFYLYWSLNILLFAQENLLNNHSFELSQNGEILDWELSSWKGSEGLISASQAPEGKSSNFCVLLASETEDDTKLTQTVAVKPNTIYRLGGWIKTSGKIEGQLGANLTVLNILETSADVKESKDNWVFCELYGQTASNQTKLTVSLRIGGYGRLAQGKACFDEISLTEVKEIPSGVKIVSFAKAETPPPPSLSLNSRSVLFLFTIFFLGLLALLFFKPLKNFFQEKSSSSKIFFIFTVIAFILRLIIALVITGHPTDLTCFKSWSIEVFEKGIPNFYFTETFKDYPPFYMYFLYLIGGLRSLFNLDYHSLAFQVLIKTPPIVADLLLALLLFKASKSKNKLLVATVILFNPALIINSAAFAQVDSIYTLLVACMLYFLYCKQILYASFFLGLSLATKPQSIIFLPLGLFLILEWLAKLPELRKAQAENQKEMRQEFWQEGGKIGLALLIASGTFVLVSLPFFLLNPVGLIDLFKRIFSSYPFASLNAFNLYSLLGLNWVEVNRVFLFLPIGIWNIIFIGLITMLSWLSYRKEKKATKPFLTASLIAVLCFCLLTNNHERYLYPAVFLSWACFLFSGRKSLLYLAGALSLVSFWNQGIVLEAALVNLFQISFQDPVLVFGSFLTCALTGYFLMIIFFPKALSWLKNKIDTLSQKEIKPFKPKQIPLDKIDMLIGFVLIIVFGFLNFYQLGCLNTPATFWQPKQAGAEVVFKIDRERNLSEFYYYSGLGTGRYQLLYSSDNIGFKTALSVDNTNPYAEFFWHKKSLDFKASYLKILVNQPGFALHEIIFKDKNEIVPLKIIKKSENQSQLGLPENLIDEQQTLPTQIDHLTGMYFDEIYYPRSVAQYLLGIPPVERTHPQLGKLIMKVGVLIFGLNPFGWRAAGAFFGVILLLIFYLVSRLLLKERKSALIITIVFGFDFMRFTQSRLATIDTFAVFFILLTYLFMLKFFQSDFAYKKRTSWLYLFLAGISFGLGLATKWTSAFTAFGILFIFIWKMILRIKEKKLITNSNSGLIKEIAIFTLWACFCFIGVAFLIYALSFGPLFKLSGEKNFFSFFINEQINMYRYHSELQASHPFSSTFWQWPLIIRPIWYYSGQPYVSPDKIANIVLLGTPIIWWFAILAIIFLFYFAFLKRKPEALFILIAFCSQYLPWALSPRQLLFLYHFFPALPFFLLGLMYCLEQFSIKSAGGNKYLVGILLASAIILFILFSPILYGSPISKDYVANFLRWLPTWVFFN